MGTRRENAKPKKNLGIKQGDTHELQFFYFDMSQHITNVQLNTVLTADPLYLKVFLTEYRNAFKASKIGSALLQNPTGCIHLGICKKKTKTSWIYEEVEALESRKDKADIVKIGKLEADLQRQLGLEALTF